MKTQKDALMLFHLEGHIWMDSFSKTDSGKTIAGCVLYQGLGVSDWQFYCLIQGRQVGFILHDASRFCDSLPGALGDQDSEDIHILCGKEHDNGLVTCEEAWEGKRPSMCRRFLNPKP